MYELYEAAHVSLHSQTSGSDVNLNVNTFIGMSQLRNYWYIFDQYKTIDILNATSKMCVCFVTLSTPKGSHFSRSMCGFGNGMNQ